MSGSAKPSPGDERIVLYPPKRKHGKHVLTRLVWVQSGFTTFYDDAARDWVQWAGSWIEVEVLGRFDGRDDARAFLIARAEAREPSVPRPVTPSPGQAQR
jgi:hypothetical protein